MGIATVVWTTGFQVDAVRASHHAIGVATMISTIVVIAAS